MIEKDARPIDRLLADPPLALFEGLTSDEVSAVVERSAIIKRTSGTYVQCRGQRSTELLVLLQGVGRILLDSGSNRNMTIALPRRGALFGESCLTQGSACSYNVLCFDDCTLLSIEKDDLVPMLQSVPQFAINLLFLSCAGVGEWASRAEVLSRADAYCKVAAILLELAAAYGTGPVETVTIHRHITHYALADLTGLSRNHACRGLTRLTKEEHVTFGGKSRLLTCNINQLRLCVASNIDPTRSNLKKRAKM